MPKILNIGAAELRAGNYPYMGDNCMLIRIGDFDDELQRPIVKTSTVFLEKIEVEFLDFDYDELKKTPDFAEMACTDDQAKLIAEGLQRALVENMNVLVHCTMGVARSGAVVDVACVLGFEDPETYRSPNLFVKHKLLAALGLSHRPLDEIKDKSNDQALETKAQNSVDHGTDTHSG